MVILQAMASGCAVVASTVTGGPDAGTDGREVMLVPPADSRSLADTLGLLVADADLRHRLGRAAHLRVGHDFTWNDYGKRAVQMYQLLTNPKPVC